MTCFPVPGFHYTDGALHAEGVALSAIAAAVGTPTYVYTTEGLTAAWRAYADAFAGQDVTICYALKANSNLAVIRTLAQLGAGGDVVSVGEMRRALAAGIPADKIVFSGVGKTRDELVAALKAGIHQINVESLPELEVLSAVAVELGVDAPIAIRINPDVDAETHGKIATGRKEDKFGIDFAHAGEAYARAMALPGINPVGIAVHIGSQLLKTTPFRKAFGKLAELVRDLKAHGVPLSRIDLGGGLGVPYKPEDQAPDYPAYAKAIAETVGGLGCHVTLEPGRSLVAAAGLLLTRTIFVKEGLHRRFLIVDAAMNDLVRPAMYEAWHTVIPVAQPAADAVLADADIVGPVCETGDTFARLRPMPPVAPGDLLAFLTAGAYGAAMSSTYNSRPLVAEVLVSGAKFEVVRRRPSFEDSLTLEQMPDWLSP
ncbi:diaminopimelate decarboxylase [Niveispirillum cyanobacteriorum]|uniref:Diaminopimelate decarboxylase n=1 Tax=Niveispirillum cyanobacteriorum TaxID=1612173 RepID=A0A2K9N9I8_9PROT|nr:diaminopimelate decarboxylase [Niveispirillum cyanobacteriorum]AUN28825.1 diaminopimelate decarboxylase [Niveispirillum cyanobacteriorum]GGE70020.1 diaminopimelate decarboxylase [Niveispirillum cyanobacteriorum]